MLSRDQIRKIFSLIVQVFGPPRVVQVSNANLSAFTVRPEPTRIMLYSSFYYHKITNAGSRFHVTQKISRYFLG
jgi:hypothetical protein